MQVRIKSIQYYLTSNTSQALGCIHNIFYYLRKLRKKKGKKKGKKRKAENDQSVLTGNPNSSQQQDEEEEEDEEEEDEVKEEKLADLSKYKQYFRELDTDVWLYLTQPLTLSPTPEKVILRWKH